MINPIGLLDKSLLGPEGLSSSGGVDNTFRAALVNTMAEVPPLCTYPRKERSTSDWSESGSYVQHTWSDARLVRHLVSSKGQLHMFDGVTQITSVGTAPSGWYDATHSIAVDNDETMDFDIKLGSDVIATASPYHGYFANVEAVEPTVAANVWHDVDSSNYHVRGYLLAGRLQIERSANPAPFQWDLSPDVLIKVAWHIGRFDRWSRDNTLYLMAERGGAIDLWTSTDYGRTFTLATTFAAGAKPTLTIAPDGRKFFYWIDGTAIKGQIWDRAGNVLETTFTAVASGVDDQGIGADVFVRGKTFTVVLLYVSSGSVTSVESTDGKTFA